jgi:uncharacterized membrane protein/glutaredoxin
MIITLYSKPGCHLCEDALEMLNRHAPRYGFEVREVNILDNPEQTEAYGERIPVVVAGDGSIGRLVAPISEKEVRKYLQMAKDRRDASSVVQGPPDFWLDRLVTYIGRRWLKILNITLAVFVGLPWLAALFAALGLWALADPIYTAYVIQCHQLPERAPTLFGYEVAQCIRCSALYGGMLLFGIGFSLARDRKVRWLQWILRPLPWYIFLLLLVPILVDGITHMAGLRGISDLDAEVGFGTFEIGTQMFSLNWWLRVITGLAAGLGAVWFAYPRMSRSMEESEELRRAYQRDMQRRYAQAAGS